MSGSGIEHRDELRRQRAKEGKPVRAPGSKPTIAKKPEPMPTEELTKRRLAKLGLAGLTPGERAAAKAANQATRQRTARALAKAEATARERVEVERQAVEVARGTVEAILAIADPAEWLARVMTGEIEASKLQVEAAKALLNKTLPSLRSVEKTVEVGANLADIFLAKSEARIAKLPSPVIDVTPEDPANG